ncbi:MAG: hypothetical protein ACFE8G_05105 [Candidatus Hermodarchaeota archaeon]
MIIIRCSIDKKLIIFTSILFLTSISILFSAVLCYGDDLNTAETLTNGDYDVTLASEDNVAYYKVYCNEGDDLQLILGCSTLLRMYIFGLDQNVIPIQVDTGQYGGTGVLDWTAIEQGAHYIRIQRGYGTDPGPVDFSLRVRGATGSQPLEIP